MAKKEQREMMNEVYLRGHISHVFGNDAYGSLTIPYNENVRRRVTNEDGTTSIETVTNTYFPEAMFNARTKTKGIIQDFRKGDSVLVKGYLGSYSSPSATGFDEHTVIYIDEVEHDTTRMEQMLGVAGVGRGHVEAAHEIRLEAKIIGITKRTDTIYVLRLECTKDGRTYAVTGTYFRSPRNLEDTFHMNDVVYIIGAMESARREFRGKVYFNQTFVIQEMVRQSDVLEKYQAAQQEENAANDMEEDNMMSESEMAAAAAEAAGEPVEESAYASEVDPEGYTESYEDTQDEQSAEDFRGDEAADVTE